jgi:RNA polymerase sigma-70 factor (ECF subfamily)
VVACLYSGNPQLWEALVLRLRPIFARIVYRVATNSRAAQPGDIDDAIQECFLKLQAARGNSQALPSAFDSEETAVAYLKVLAANAARDYFRMKNAEKRSAAKTTSLEDQLHEVIGGDAPALEREVLIRQIDRFLPGGAKARTVFWLYYRQGFTAKEIASVPAFHLTPKGVESLIRRLTTVIRKKFHQREGFSGPEAYE